MLLRGIIAIERRISREDGIIPLEIGDVTAFLDLRDPRFLQVPRELARIPPVLAQLLRPGDTFIDVGANHGAYSISAARLIGPEGLVISIDPQPRLAGLLRKLLANGPSRFEVHQIACGDRSRETEFYIPWATSGSAGVFREFSGRSSHKTIRVEVRPLDDVIGERRLPGRIVIKLDVEGSELAFLQGARRLIEAAAPVLLIEINPRAMRAAGTSKTNLVQTLLDLGYDRFTPLEDPGSAQRLTSEIPGGDFIMLPIGEMLEDHSRTKT